MLAIGRNAITKKETKINDSILSGETTIKTRKDIIMRKIIIMVAIFVIGLQTNAVADDVCITATGFSDELNQSAPVKIDEYTRVLRTDVDCKKKVFTYSKQIESTEDIMLSGWNARKQNQHTILHCNEDGLSSVFGWSVVDFLYDVNGKSIAVFVTNPKDCK